MSGSGDSKGGTVGFSAAVLGLAGAAVAHLVFGLAWTGSAFLFFPVFGLVLALFGNDGARMAKNAVTFLLFATFASAMPVFAARAVAAISRQMPLGHAGAIAVSVLVTGAFFVAVSFAASLVARAFGNPTLPAAVHGVLCKAAATLAASVALGGFVAFVRWVDTGVLPLPGVAKVAISLVATLAFAVTVWRVFRGKPALPAVADGKGTDVGALRLASRPETTFRDVAGMADVKEQIRLRLIEPVRNAAKAKRYGLKVGGGMLLYGPPGTGKTLLARAVAGELGLPFYRITAADIFGKYVGESERNIRKIFAEVRKNPLAVVFIDELETLFPKRDGAVHETTRKVISVILQELDGVDRAKNPILLLGATNVPWRIDEAFLRPGRFDVKAFVGLPDIEARAGIIAKAFSEGSVPCQPGLVAYLANLTRNYSGADLNGVIGKMRQCAYDRSMTQYTRELADRVVATTSPSAIGDILDRIREWEAATLPENSGNSGSAGVRLAVRPTTKLDDVAGMADVKEQIRLRLVEPVRNHTLANMYGLKTGGGVLLYGPPGTGKTFLARAVAGELGLPFYAITAADVFGRYVGESERNIRKIFRDARKNDLSVVFIDELEALVPNRDGNADESTQKVISVLLQELDGIDPNKNPILLLGATNVPWRIDEAFLRPGRFDVKVFVGLPDADARRQMFITALYRCRIPHEAGLTGYLANATEGFSGADINGVIERLQQLAYARRAEMFTAALVDEVMAASRPTADGDILRRIREWERKTA